MTEVQGIILPKKKVAAVTSNPKRLIIYSKPKTGKTSALAGLDNCLILDFEKGSDYVEALKLKVNSIQELKQIGEAIKAEGKPYKYIAVDTVTALEDLALPLAGKLYQATPMGRSWTGDNVLTLPNGGGYLYHRQAMEQLLNYIDTLADHIILLGHLKDRLISTPDGKEVNASDIDLIGKVKNIICSKADAIGLMTRKDNQCILSFKTSDTITCGARPAHLKNQEIVLSEEVDGKLVTNWNKIFVD
jgi:AAA domain